MMLKDLRQSLTVRANLFRLQRRIGKARQVILAFHRVLPVRMCPAPYDSCPSIPEDFFKSILKFIRSHFEVVSLRELADRRHERIPFAAITFDDGWRDNYEFAFPILKELELPASIFIVTGKLSSDQCFWQQELGRAFQVANKHPDTPLGKALHQRFGAPTKSRFDVADYRAAVWRTKQWDLATIHSSIADVVGLLPGRSDRPRLFLSPGEIREMQRGRVDFGSHTVSHTILTVEDPSIAALELSRSKERLEQILQSRVDTLSYPNGNYSEDIIRLAAVSGYRIACTTANRPVHRDDTMFKLPRIDVGWHDSPTKSFLRAYLPATPRINGKVALPNGDRPETQQSGKRSFATNQRQCSNSNEAPSSPRTIRVLYLIDEFASSYGGTEQHLLFLLNNLPRSRFEPHVAVLRNGGAVAAPLRRFKPICLREIRSSSIARAISAVRQLRSLIRRRSIDLVHTYFPESEVTAVLAAALGFRRVPVVASRRNLGYWHTHFSRWRSRIQNCFIDHFLANCEAARSYTQRVEWVPLNKIHVIPNPIIARTTDVFEGALTREWLGIGIEEQIVGIVASVRPVKDHATLLRAARIISVSRPRVRFLVIGEEEGNLGSSLRNLCEELGISARVSWLGPLDDPLRIIPLFDVAVLTSRSESLSNSLIEYAACGVATVATDVGGAQEVVVHGKTGFLVPPGSHEDLASRVLQLLNDGQLRAQFGTNGRDRALSKFNAESVIRAYESYYAKVLGVQL
jgi:glycosyltransferase involved in cell wall biosynthesis/peptidoglycan/xylan/chitin deacetylase (PgdA/CDA1 family)